MLAHSPLVIQHITAGLRMLTKKVGQCLADCAAIRLTRRALQMTLNIVGKSHAGHASSPPPSRSLPRGEGEVPLRGMAQPYHNFKRSPLFKCNRTPLMEQLSLKGDMV